MLKAKNAPDGLILRLLRYAAGRPAAAAESRHARASDAHALQFLGEAGLAPLMQHAIAEGALSAPEAWTETLLAAALTAQVRHGAMIDAANDVIDTCHGLAVPVTLIKGISISDEFYPAAHLRPMGDVDVLVEASDYAGVEAALLALGYRSHPGYEQRPGAHHGVPLIHPSRRVIIELHTALFSADDPLRSNALFSRAQVGAQVVASAFNGRTVSRLTAEMQLVYLAASWLHNLSRNGFHATLVPPLFDAVYMFKARGSSLDWDAMFDWLDNDLARCALYLMVRYVDRLGLDESAREVLPRLRAGQRRVGPLELRIIDAMLDTYLIRGMPFTRLFNAWHASIVFQTLLAARSPAVKLGLIARNIALPPGIEKPGSMSYQLGRIARLLRRRD